MEAGLALQVIGAALPRTGTLSLKFALERLGFGRCYHMTELITHPEHTWRWTFARIAPGLLDPLWRDYHATVDSPGCMLWRQFARRFPQAKVILTRRDPESWYDSVSQTVGDPQFVKIMLRSPMFPALLALNPFGLRKDRAAMIAHFERYGHAVRAAIPPDRLLEFEAKDGWEPLCAFLGVPVPDEPYPRANERAAIQDAGGVDPITLSFAQIQQRVRAYLVQEGGGSVS